jgi:hypothetical protein
MTPAKQYTSLDFDVIKQSIIDNFKSDPTFTDYDFSGSAINTLIEILAYNQHYHAVYANAVQNEMFLDTAQTRNSVVSKAKELGYIPRSVVASTAFVNLTCNNVNQNVTSLLLPRGTQFKSSNDSGDQKFVVAKDVYSSMVGGVFRFNDVELKEGKLVENVFLIENGQKTITIPNQNIDTTTIVMKIKPSSDTNVAWVEYFDARSFSTIDGASHAFFLQEGYDGKYQIYFGDDIFGKSIQDGNVINVSYVASTGVAGNQCKVFALAGSITNVGSVTVSTIMAASGGSARETIDSIKFYAPLQYQSQNRSVTKNDFLVAIKNEVPYIRSVSVWGGEENDPPMYGKVFCSLNAETGYAITDSVKENIIKPLIRKKSSITVIPEIIDPDYLFISIQTRVKINRSKMVGSYSDMITSVSNSIIQYFANDVEEFGKEFYLSSVMDKIGAINSSVISNKTDFVVHKRFIPTLRTANRIQTSFGSAIKEIWSNTFFVMVNGTLTKCRFVDDGIGGIDLVNSAGEVIYASIGTVSYSTGKIDLVSEVYSLNNQQVYINVYARFLDTDIKPIRNQMIFLSGQPVNVITGDIAGLEIQLVDQNNIQLN